MAMEVGSDDPQTACGAGEQHQAINYENSLDHQ
jgi:hypothetical protein